ncbi:MAG: undecaprenyl-diphosphate phosphatase [Thermodesulfobacteriota bacterium]
MEILKAIILGVVQGLTEFLPISSSGHLVLVSKWLNFHEQGLAFDVFVHFGTLFSVCIVFRHEILAMLKAPLAVFQGRADEELTKYWRWDIYVVVATLPAVVVGLLLKDSIEGIFSNILLVYCMLLVTGIIMTITPHLKERAVNINCPRAFLIGCAQAMAILPGISRSGSTIFTGMLLGVNREVVARFSFIMSIPAILGAVILQSRDLIANPPAPESLLTIGAGTVAAAISGYFAIILLLNVIRKNKLQYFGYYCLALASAGLIYHFISA